MKLLTPLKLKDLNDLLAKNELKPTDSIIIIYDVEAEQVSIIQDIEISHEHKTINILPGDYEEDPYEAFHDEHLINSNMYCEIKIP